MKVSSYFLCFFILLSLLQPLSCLPLHHRRRSKHGTESKPVSKNAPTTYFEVSKPIDLPKTKPCSYLLLKHDFAYTYDKPPVVANYTPPLDCPDQDYDRIVLEWKAEVKGEQFDRILGVWIGGVEILRGCTAEPTQSGIVWTVNKDVTKYSSLFKSQQTLVVYLGNVVDKTYTGVYHVSINIHFYPRDKEKYVYDSPGFGFDTYADLILPVSREMPLNDGLWFEIESSSDMQIKKFKIPRNAYRALLEVYVSFHEKDEFWYNNLPNEYILANNLSEVETGNGPFREVVVSLDGNIVGAVWPFTVVYTGGLNPLLWTPISGIGSFDLPSYDIQITPFLGRILDGKTHRFGFSVTNALNVWNVDANLHLWLDKKSDKTHGKVLNHYVSPLHVSSNVDFSGFDGSFGINAKRTISTTGLVNSSYGVITTKATQGFSFTNSMVLRFKGTVQTVDQMIVYDDEVFDDIPRSLNHTIRSIKRFPFSMHSGYVDYGHETYVSSMNISLGFNENKTEVFGSRTSVNSRLENLQKAQGNMVVKHKTAVEGFGSTEQTYNYLNDGSCYYRNVKSSNYTIDYDYINDCSKNLLAEVDSGSNLGRRRSVGHGLGF